MPNIKSAEKRMRQNIKRRAANRATRSAERTEIKKARVAIEEAAPEALKEQLVKTISTLDKCARKGLIHKNKAARQVSRLTRQANARQEKPQS